MKLSTKLLKRIAIDILGFGLLLLLPFVGALPGPGGIAVFIAAMSLLSINHEWARRLRDYVFEHGGKISKKIFPDNFLVQLIYDLLAIFLIVTALLLFISHVTVGYIFFGATLLFAGVTIFFVNRERWDKLKKYLKRK